jgi:hypothetical protein
MRPPHPPEAAAQKEYETKMAAYDAEVARIKKLQSLGMPSQVANQMIANVVKPKAPVVGPTEAADNPNVSYNDTSKIFKTKLFVFRQNVICHLGSYHKFAVWPKIRKALIN